MMKPASNISIPAKMKSWVCRQARAKGFKTADELVQDMIRREQAAETHQTVESQLLDAIDSGPTAPMLDSDWERIRTEGRKRFAARAKK